MTLSREVINPHLPRDIDRIKREGYATSKISLGRVVVRTDHETIVECDGTITGGGAANDEAHMMGAAEFVWIDAANRFDVPVVQKDGTEVYQHTTLPAGAGLVVDLHISTLFENGSYTPADGDLLIKSRSTAGKVEAVSVSTFESIVSGNGSIEYTHVNKGLFLGTVEGAGEDSGFCRVTLGR